MSTIRRGIALCLTAALLPTALASQVNAPGQQRRVGRMQRDNCASSDSTRSFRRGVGADSTSAAGGASQISGGTQRSHEYPEFDVVLDIPNVCVGKIFPKVDSVTERL